MPYAVGETIEASTYNNLASQVNVIYGLGSSSTGYGQASITAVVAGSTVRAADWLELRNNIDDVVTHQGTTPIGSSIPPTTDFEVGDLIIAYDGSSGRWNLPATVASSFDNRLNVDAGQSTVTASALFSLRGTSWSTQLQHIFTVTFASQDDARHFFNSGGQIRIRAERAGGAATPQNADWTALLAAAGTYTFEASAYFAANASTGNIQRFTQTGASAYAANDWTIFEKRDTLVDPNSRGGQGRIITFQVEFNDDSTGFSDVVDGSVRNIIDRRTATGAFSTSSIQPSLATTTELTAGS